MLEFLGLQKEAHTVTVALILIFGAIGLAIGRSTAKDKGSLTVFINGFCIVAGVAGLIKGFGPAIILFFTFQWGVLLRGTFMGILLGCALGIPVYMVSMAFRRRSFQKNPVLQEAAAFCRENHIVGIQCYGKQLRFFSALENEEYCKSENKVIHEETRNEGIWTESKDLRPYSWQAYDRAPSYKGTLTFADRGYPELPDVGFFADTLARELKGFACANHSVSVKYKYSRFNKDTGKTEYVDHTTHTYSDHFVYSKKALADLRKKNKPKETAVAKPTNKWE